MTQEQYNMYMNGLILKVASKKPLTKTASKFTIMKRLKDLVNFGPKKLELNSLKNKGKDVLDYIKANKLGLGTAAGVGAGATASGFGISNALSDAGAATKGFISANPYAAAGVGAAGALAAGLLGAYLLRKDEKEKANA